MGEMMTFPNDYEEFIAQHQFWDKKQEYTNGSLLIPVFRVEQMIEHYFEPKLKVEWAYECRAFYRCTVTDEVILKTEAEAISWCEKKAKQGEGYTAEYEKYCRIKE